jgi:chromosome segregation ATPase
MKEEKERDVDPERIRESLDEVVVKLEQDKASSQSWDTSVSENRGKWEQLKSKIKERQKALKALVMEKKSGTIGQAEFDEKYRVLQDELAELEFEVYNLRLGTKIKR